MNTILKLSKNGRIPAPEGKGVRGCARARAAKSGDKVPLGCRRVSERNHRKAVALSAEIKP